MPAYLLALGHGQLEVGFRSTATLVGSAIATLAVGRWGHRFALRRLLLAAAVLMVATGLGFATITSLWPLLVVAFMGPLNPSGGDVSVFLPLEHTVLAASASAEVRTGVFARDSFVGSIFGAMGALPGLVRNASSGRGACVGANIRSGTYEDARCIQRGIARSLETPTPFAAALLACGGTHDGRSPSSFAAAALGGRDRLETRRQPVRLLGAARLHKGRGPRCERGPADPARPVCSPSSRA